MPGKKNPWAVVTLHNGVMRRVSDDVQNREDCLGWIRWKGKRGTWYYPITLHGGPYSPDGKGGLEEGRP